MSRFAFRLYVTGRSPRGERAIASMRRICEQVLGGDCDLSIIDVLENPRIAEEDAIMATPTVIRTRPAPTRRVIGDFSDTGRVLIGLDLLCTLPSGGAVNEH